jgi:antitoxin component of MazEF toxin-antitoxin module
VLARFRRGLTFSNVVSLVALFVALGGGAYALAIPKNSVGTRQLKKSAVTSSKIQNGAVSASKVKPHSLLANDFKLGQLPAGPKGVKGDKGDQGPKGPAGTAVAYGYVHADGTFDASRSLNLLASVNTATNVYCLRFASAPKSLVGSVDVQFGGFVTVSIDPTTIGNSCAIVLPAANAVALTVAANGNGSPRDFYVAAAA